MLFRLLTPIIFFFSFLTFLRLWLLPQPTPTIFSNQPVLNSTYLSDPTLVNLPSLLPSKHIGSSTSAPTIFESLMSARLKRIRNECARMKEMGELRDSWLLPENFITSTKHQLSWCPLYKAGSTSWMKTMLLLEGINTGSRKDWNYMARSQMSYNYQETIDHLSSGEVLLVVRDPWERLLSAYRDKLEVARNDDQAAFLESYGRHMVSKYREEGLQRFGEAIYRQNAGAPIAVEGRSLHSPTFWEFSRWIIDGGEMDRHWNPYYLHCNLCHTKYTAVLKLENVEEEGKRFLSSTNMTQNHQQWKNRSPGEKTADLLPLYYSTLSLTELLQLQQIYKPDFRLFGYSQSRVFTFRQFGRAGR